jgi:hypothetical protein
MQENEESERGKEREKTVAKIEKKEFRIQNVKINGQVKILGCGVSFFYSKSSHIWYDWQKRFNRKCIRPFE